MSFPHNATIALFVCYPIGILINFLPHGESRHACSFFSGFLILYLAVGRHWVHHAITCLLSYSIFLSLSPRLSRVLVLLVLLVYLGFAHVNSASAQTFHFSSTQMILTQKLSSLAFNLEDGHFLTHKNQDDARSWSVQRHKHARFQRFWIYWNISDTLSIFQAFYAVHSLSTRYIALPVTALWSTQTPPAMAESCSSY